MRRLLLAAPLLFIASSARAEDRTLFQAKMQARTAGKPLLVEFHADWCGPCQYIEREVMPDERIQAALSRFVFVRYDTETTLGETVSRELDATGLPTFVVFDPSGTERLREQGVARLRTVDGFAVFLDEALAVGATAESNQRRLSSTDVRELLAAARWMEVRDRVDEALELLARAEAAAGQTKAGATAAWRALDLRLAAERRAAYLAGLTAFATKHPAAAETTKALIVLGASGTVPTPRLEVLIRAHASMLMDPEPTSQVAFVALSASLPELALELLDDAATEYGWELEGELRLAEALAYLGRFEKADEAVGRAQGHARTDMARARVRAMRDHVAHKHRRSQHLERVRELGKRVLEDLRHPGSTEHRPTTTSAAFRLVMQWYRDIDGYLRDAARTCGSYAGGRSEVYVRMTFAGHRERPKSVDVIEAGVPRRLRECVEQSLGKHRYPLPPPLIRKPYTAPIRFRVHAASAADDEERPAGEQPRWAHTYFYGWGSAGAADLLGAGVRSLQRAGRLADFRNVFQLDANVGGFGSGELSYDVALLSGLAISHPKAIVGLLVGLGASRLGDALPAAFDANAEFNLAVNAGPVRGQAWFRTRWILDEDTRRAQANGNALFGGDELQIGVAARLPARAGPGVFVGAVLRSLPEDRSISLLLGTSLDTF